MKTHDLYSVPNMQMEEAKVAIEQALNLQFEAHDSFYVGEYYQVISPDGERVKLRNNIDPFDNEPAELKFPDATLLLYIDNTERYEEIEILLQRLNVLLLKRKHLDK